MGVPDEEKVVAANDTLSPVPAPIVKVAERVRVKESENVKVPPLVVAVPQVVAEETVTVYAPQATVPCPPTEATVRVNDAPTVKV